MIYIHSNNIYLELIVREASHPLKRGDLIGQRIPGEVEVAIFNNMQLLAIQRDSWPRKITGFIFEIKNGLVFDFIQRELELIIFKFNSLSFFSHFFKLL